MSPSSSTRIAANAGIDVFDILFDKISEVSNNGHVCLIGDLNARIADFNYPCMQDDDDEKEYVHGYLVSDKSIFQSDTDTYTRMKIIPVQNQRFWAR